MASWGLYTVICGRHKWSAVVQSDLRCSCSKYTGICGLVKARI